MEENTAVKSDKTKKVVIGCLVSLAVLLIGIYVFVAVYYTDHFYPGTSVNGIIFDNADESTVTARLMAQAKNYQLQVLGRDVQSFESTELCVVSAGDINLVSSVENADVQVLLEGQRSWLWPIYIPGNHQLTLQGKLFYDEELLTEYLNALDAFQEKSMVAPRDAYIEGYSEERQSFVLVPEVTGSKLDIARAHETIAEAIREGRETVSLEETGCYAVPSITAGSADLQQSLAAANKWLETKITYDWNGHEVVLAGGQIKDWIVLKDDGVALDEEAVAAFVKENADAYDTYGKNRMFHTILGYDLNLPGGAFGWLTDQEAEVKELTALIQAGAVGEKEPVYASKGPWKGTNDIGNSYLEADMTHQHLYLYQKGEIVLESDFVSGNMSNGCTTPQGVFGITYKTMNAVLRGADYVTPVTYWMPFNGNYGLHDATWRDTFGGDIYLTDGSHGCLNLPLDKAGEIYQYMTEGFPVICYYYPPGMLPEPEQEIPDDD